jgi:hypothetical protein
MAAPNIAPLADALLALPSGEQDITDVYDALAPLLPHDAFVELGHALELCPVHRCDERIELVVEVAYRIGLGPDETEQGPTEKAVREIDAFIDRHDPVR